MNEWFADMGAYFMAFPDAPGLAVDMALSGPPSPLGYSLAANMIGTSSEIEIYPPDENSFEGLG